MIFLEIIIVLLGVHAWVYNVLISVSSGALIIQFVIYNCLIDEKEYFIPMLRFFSIFESEDEFYLVNTQFISLSFFY